jgi:hypothetical protein
MDPNKIDLTKWSLTKEETYTLRMSRLKEYEKELTDDLFALKYIIQKENGLPHGSPDHERRWKFELDATLTKLEGVQSAIRNLYRENALGIVC